MKALKAIVIFMGVLIVIGMGVVAYGIMLKFDEWQAKKDAAPAPGPLAVTAPAATTPVVTEVWTGELKVPIPAGARVAETIVAEGQMIVRLSLADDSQHYLVFDLGTGKQIGAIVLQPQGGVQ